MEPSVFVGIDVSKAQLDIAVLPSGETWQVANDEPGRRQLVSRLTPLGPQARVLLEATGGYERSVVATLATAALDVVLVNPRQVRDFARATGQLAKTDRLDALILAQFAERIRPEPRPLATDQTLALQELVTRRRQLVDMLVAEEQRGRAATAVRVQRDISRHVAWLKRQLGNLEDDLDGQIRQSPLWRAKDKLLQSVPGIGPTVSRVLIAQLPELGTLSHKKIAALVGVAPLARDSGTMRGHRIIWGGRASVRTALFMAAVVAIRWNPPIRAFYLRLRQAGKAAKLALIACARKLLVTLNAMVRSQVPWQLQEIA